MKLRMNNELTATNKYLQNMVKNKEFLTVLLKSIERGS